MGKSLHLDIAKWTSITFVLVLFFCKRLSCLVARAAYHASGNAGEVGKNVCARALRQHAAIENLLTDAPQQSLEFYDSWLSAQAAEITPEVLLGGVCLSCRLYRAVSSGFQQQIACNS